MPGAGGLSTEILKPPRAMTIVVLINHESGAQSSVSGGQDQENGGGFKEIGNFREERRADQSKLPGSLLAPEECRI
jgi:hypothetical protein